jgi:uncharacterized protein YkwD
MRVVLYALLISIFTMVLPAIATVDADQLAVVIFDEANRVRKENGRTVLLDDARLEFVAQTHSDDMMARNYKSHYNPEGEGPADRVHRLYPQLLGDVGENLLGIEIENGVLDPVQLLAQQTVEEWMNSPEHRENLMNPIFTHMAVAVSTRGESFLATQLLSCEYIVLERPLPKAADENDVLEIKGEVRPAWDPSKLTVFLVLPNPKEEVKISETKVSVGTVPLQPLVHGHIFTVSVQFNHGNGVYRIGFGQKGREYYPMGEIEVK